MFGRKKNNFYRYMFQKSFMPLFAMLVVISMAFLILSQLCARSKKIAKMIREGLKPVYHLRNFR